MKSIRWKQLDKINKMYEAKTKSKFIAMILEENNGVFIHPTCSGCGQKLYLGDEYAFNYGSCSVGCGMTTFGLSWSDFY